MGKVQTNRSPEVLTKYEEVVRLRSVGLSFQQIADRVGYAGRSGAKAAYSEAIKMWGAEAVEEHRILENERLDYLWRTTLGQIESATRENDPGTAIAAINTAIRVSSRRSSLNGLDAPRQVQLQGIDGGPLQTDIGEFLRTRLARLEEISDVSRVELENSPEN